jgi:sigma-54-specific transcriptional regulator
MLHASSIGSQGNGMEDQTAHAAPDPLVFEDARSRALVRQIGLIAPGSANVVLLGEPGTGKRTLADRIHGLSRHRVGELVTIDCGAADAAEVDRAVERALAQWRGGTLFLDRVAYLPRDAQLKLLRALQARELGGEPDGGALRVVSSTVIDIDRTIGPDRFRRDLYFRLRSILIDVPPLRQRPRDILPLARRLLAAGCSRLDLPPCTLGDAAAEQLLARSWLGNIPELERVVHAALLRCAGAEIARADLPSPATQAPSPAADADPIATLARTLPALFAQGLPDLHAHVEQSLLRAAYNHCRRNQLRTAQLLGLNRNVLRARLLAMGELGQAEQPLTTGIAR